MNNKKLIIVLLLVCVILVGGGTLAYFNSRHTSVTSLSTDIYQTRVTDTFTSPENFVPGTYIERDMKLINTGDVKVAVRAKIEQSWTSANGDELPLAYPNYTITEEYGSYDFNGSCMPIIYFNNNVFSGVRDINMFSTQQEAIEYASSMCDNVDYNLDNSMGFSHWTYDREEYYYYNYYVNQNEETTPLISSIMFNPDIENNYSCTTNNGVESCTSTGNGYDGATYTLTVTFETVQYDKYQEYWNTFIEIVDEPYHTTIESNLVNLNSITAGTISINPISITNTSDKKVVVRAKLQETVDGEEIVHYYNGHENYYASIVYSEVTSGNNYWYKDREYLYYYKKLNPNETITHLIDSISFNESENKTYKLDVTYEIVEDTQYLNYFDFGAAVPNIRYNTPSRKISYTNNTNDNVVLRAKVTGKWYDLNDNEIQEVSPVEFTINQPRDSDAWIKSGNYYYYNNSLPAQSSLPGSLKNKSQVTFETDYVNPLLGGNGPFTITFSALPNVKYVAELVFEIAPYETYKTDWNTDVEIIDILPLIS